MLMEIETFKKCSILFTFKEGDPAAAGLSLTPARSEAAALFERMGAFCKGLKSTAR